MFYVGQRVECVRGHVLVIKGQHYTIERGSYLESWGGPYVTLIGIANSFGHRGFYAYRFRPLVEKKTDISVFTALLKPVRQDA
jgi:hypothetical protein